MGNQRRIKKGQRKGSQFQAAALERLHDADTLIKKGRIVGGMYLGGYAVECMLKWAITKHKNMICLPACYEHHELRKLLDESGLLPSLQHTDAAVEFAAFSEVSRLWREEFRYESSPLSNFPKDPALWLSRAKSVVIWINKNAPFKLV